MLAALLGAGCGERGPAVALPEFAAGLPGATVAVVWGGGAESLPDQVDALLARLGIRALPAADGVRALAGEPGSVGWRSLADNALFAEAVAELPPGDVHAFVDLQQAVDAATRAFAGRSRGDGLPGALTGLAAKRVVDALRLRGLQWLAAGVRRGEASFAVDAMVAGAGDGVLGALAGGDARAMPAHWPDHEAAARVQVRFSPAAVARMVRDLVGGEDGGAIDMMREAFRGPRLDAALAALEGLGGSAAVVAGEDGAWAWASLRAPDAVAGALDTFAAPAQDGWQLGPFRLAIAGGALTATTAAAERPTRPVPATSAALWLDLPRAGQSWTVDRAGEGRWRVRGGSRR